MASFWWGKEYVQMLKTIYLSFTPDPAYFLYRFHPAHLPFPLPIKQK